MRQNEPSDNNFEQTLLAAQAMFANEVFRSGYNLEQALITHLQKFLLELGKGFTYIGNQHVLEYTRKRSRVDMLFFHRGLLPCSY